MDKIGQNWIIMDKTGRNGKIQNTSDEIKNFIFEVGQKELSGPG